MKVQSIVYVTEMGRSQDWYGKVFGTSPAFASDMWTPFELGDATVALHRTANLSQGSRCDLSLVTDLPLEVTVRRLEEAGVTIERGIRDETFGRSILLRDPDGTPIQINEHD